jgi:hypothetical protein
LEIDTITAREIVEVLQTCDVKHDLTVNLHKFANKYIGNQFKPTFIICYLLFARLFHGMGKERDMEYEFQHNVIMETLSQVTNDSIFVKYEDILCFVFQFFTVDENDFIEYWFWLMTKGERTLDRGEVAMLMQMILMEKKEEFLKKYKGIIQHLLVEQSNESIILSRFQYLNASFGALFTRSMKDCQLHGKQHFFGKSFWKSNRLEIYQQLLYQEQSRSYQHLLNMKTVAMNNTMKIARKDARKYIRNYLRLCKSYDILRANTPLLFKNQSNGLFNMKWMSSVFQKLPMNRSTTNTNNASPSKLQLSKTSKVKSTTTSSSWLSFPSLLKSSSHANTKSNQELLLIQQQQQQQIQQLLTEDPFAFEAELAYTLDMPLATLMNTATEEVQTVDQEIHATEQLMEEMMDEFNAQYQKMGLSHMIIPTSKRHNQTGGGSFGSRLSVNTTNATNSNKSTSRPSILSTFRKGTESRKQRLLALNNNDSILEEESKRKKTPRHVLTVGVGDEESLSVSDQSSSVTTSTLNSATATKLKKEKKKALKIKKQEEAADDFDEEGEEGEVNDDEELTEDDGSSVQQQTKKEKPKKSKVAFSTEPEHNNSSDEEFTSYKGKSQKQENDEEEEDVDDDVSILTPVTVEDDNPGKKKGKQPQQQQQQQENEKHLKPIASAQKNLLSKSLANVKKDAAKHSEDEEISRRKAANDFRKHNRPNKKNDAQIEQESRTIDDLRAKLMMGDDDEDVDEDGYGRIEEVEDDDSFVREARLYDKKVTDTIK